MFRFRAHAAAAPSTRRICTTLASPPHRRNAAAMPSAYCRSAFHARTVRTSRPHRPRAAAAPSARHSNSPYQHAAAASAADDADAHPRALHLSPAVRILCGRSRCQAFRRVVVKTSCDICPFGIVCKSCGSRRIQCIIKQSARNQAERRCFHRRAAHQR